MFDHISKHLEVRQKYSAARRIFNSLLGVWKCDETLSLVFDILLTTLVGIFVVDKCFRLILESSVNKTLVWIFIKVFLTKIMNFAAADENSQINNEREKRNNRGKQILMGTKTNGEAIKKEGKGREGKNTLMIIRNL